MRAAIPCPVPNWAVLRVLLFLWTLPTNLVGHALGLAASGRRPKRIGGARVSGWAYPLRWSGVGAITIGDVVLYDEPFMSGVRGRVLFAHELAHVAQHRVLGPFYLAAHATAQVVSALRAVGKGSFVDLVHAHNPLEQRWIRLPFDACDAVARMPAPEREQLLGDYGVGSNGTASLRLTLSIAGVLLSTRSRPLV